MAAAIVHSTNVNPGNNSTGSVAQSASATSGNMMVLAAIQGSNGNTINSVATTVGSTAAWTKVIAAANASPVDAGVEVWYAPCTGNGAVTAFVTYSGTCGMNLSLFEISGLGSAPTIASGTAGLPTSTTVQVPALTPGAGAFMLALDATASAMTAGPTQGYTVFGSVGNFAHTAYLITLDGNTYNPTWTQTSNSDYLAIAASFIAAGAAATPVTPQVVSRPVPRRRGQVQVLQGPVNPVPVPTTIVAPPHRARRGVIRLFQGPVNPVAVPPLVVSKPARPRRGIVRILKGNTPAATVIPAPTTIVSRWVRSRWRPRQAQPILPPPAVPAVPTRPGLVSPSGLAGSVVVSPAGGYGAGPYGAGPYGKGSRAPLAGVVNPSEQAGRG